MRSYWNRPRIVVFYSPGVGGGYEELKAEVIINFNGMCLVRAAGESAWWMGQLHDGDKSIVCWGQYGADLERAIRAL